MGELKGDILFSGVLPTKGFLHRYTGTSKKGLSLLQPHAGPPMAAAADLDWDSLHDMSKHVSHILLAVAIHLSLHCLCQQEHLYETKGLAIRRPLYIRNKG